MRAWPTGSSAAVLISTPNRRTRPKDGQWVIDNKRQTVYAKVELSLRDRIEAARRLVNPG
jgi:hypothetical protein